MNLTCRLCLSKTQETTSFHESREGLTISVLVMIICPIKVEDEDDLPKQICENCLEILLSAYQLRFDSLKSDRYLRDCGFQQEYESEPEVNIVKHEPIFVDSSVVFEQKTKTPTKTPVKIEHGKHYVDYGKSLKKGASQVWRHIGLLCNEFGEVVDPSSYYCGKCVEQNILKKFRRTKSEYGTSFFWKHLRHVHNIQNPSVKGKRVPLSVRLTLPSDDKVYTCDLCLMEFNSKQNIEFHMLNIHVKNNSLTRSQFRVLCLPSSTKYTSTVWKYFGTLVNSDETEVKDQRPFYHCKICVEEENKLTSKFLRPSTASVLGKHLKLKHPFILKGTNEILINAEGFGVNCSKSSPNSSEAWDYIGELVDSSYQTVKSESEHLFCKLCVSQRIYKKLSATSSTSTFFKHLKIFHGIVVGARKVKEESAPAFQAGNSTQQSDMVCTEEFTPTSSTHEHIRSEHGSDSHGLICHICSKFFLESNRFEQHMKTHDVKCLFCPQCPKSFGSIEALKRHEKVHDPNHFSRYQCDQCSKFYSGKAFLRTHIKEKHLNLLRAKKHACKLCDSKFITSYNLQIHLRKHTGEKPHRCQYCSSSFSQKGELYTHLQRMHVGDALYSCTFEGCTETFRLQVDLREHYKVHYQNAKTE